MSKLGQLIRARRRELDMTQTQLGLESGLGTTHICQIERGHRNPSVDALACIAKALAVSVDELMEDAEAAQAVKNIPLRDYFAAKAMHAEILTTAGDTTPQAAEALVDAAARYGRTVEQQIAFNAYAMADAMLKARAA